MKSVVGGIYHLPKDPSNPLDVQLSKWIADEFVFFDFPEKKDEVKK